MKNKTLALQVKALRKKNGLSQEDLAENSGISLRTIQRIEKGETEPRGDTLKRLALSLNVSSDELIDWAVVEDKGYLLALNMSAFSFLLFPLLGILIPLVMWFSKKDKIKKINKVGKSIINFQITWVLIFSACFILNSLLLAYKFNTSGIIDASTLANSLKNQLLLVIIMYVFNFIITLVNSYRIYKEKEEKYFPKINFLRA